MTLLGSIYKGTLKGAGYGTAAASSFIALGFFASNDFDKQAKDLCGNVDYRTLQSFSENRGIDIHALNELSNESSGSTLPYTCFKGPGPMYIYMSVFMKAGPIMLAPFVIAAGAALGGTIGAVTYCLSKPEEDNANQLRM